MEDEELVHGDGNGSQVNMQFIASQKAELEAARALVIK